MSKKKHRGYLQGIFTPIYEKKYVGTHPIIYRSSYELRFMRWCDRNSRVLRWGSESVIIPYRSPIDGRMHRYFVDNIIEYKSEKGDIKKYLVEIKPSKFTRPPKHTNRRNKSKLLMEQVQYARNVAKWQAAGKWCQKNGCNFLMLTEKELNI